MEPPPGPVPGPESNPGLWFIGRCSAAEPRRPARPAFSLNAGQAHRPRQVLGPRSFPFSGPRCQASGWSWLPQPRAPLCRPPPAARSPSPRHPPPGAGAEGSRVARARSPFPLSYPGPLFQFPPDRPALLKQPANARPRSPSALRTRPSSRSHAAPLAPGGLASADLVGAPGTAGRHPHLAHSPGARPGGRSASTELAGPEGVSSRCPLPSRLPFPVPAASRGGGSSPQNSQESGWALLPPAAGLLGGQGRALRDGSLR